MFNDTDENVDALVEELNNLSDNAFYIVSRPYFGEWIDGGDFNAKSALMVTQNKLQEEVYAELAKAGFVWMDTERGRIGFRSSGKGRYAHYLIKASSKAKIT